MATTALVIPPLPATCKILAKKTKTATTTTQQQQQQQ
jgi:hypothetical protein